MEYRKLIKFGNSSFVVSLPKTWTEKNNLKKGDTLYLEENGDNELILAKEKVNFKIPFKKIAIDISRKDDNPIRREIASAYIGNYRQITIVGNNLGQRVDFIRETLHDFIALEIVEQTNDRIIARDFLNIAKIDIDKLIRRIDLLVRSMIYDIKQISKNKGIAEVLSKRDKDINRLTFLICRTCKFYMSYPTLKNSNKTVNFYLKTWSIAENLEKIGDELKRISAVLCNEIISEDLLKEFINLFEEIELFYNNALKSYYGYDVQLACALEAVDNLLAVKLRTNTIWGKVSLKQYLLVEKLHNVIEYIHRISKVVSYV